MKRLIIILCCAFFFTKSAGAEDTVSAHFIFIKELADCFQNYYQGVSAAGKTHSAEEKLVIELRRLLRQYGFSEHQLTEDNIEDLEAKLNSVLINTGYRIVLFAAAQTEIINCWLGKLVVDKKETRNIWGKDIEATVIILNDLEIHDYSNFLSAGKEAIEAGTRAGIIYYNLDAYRASAASVWDFFAQREKENKSRRYDPRLSNRLRKKLYIKNWLTLYLSCIKINPDNKENARREFIDKAVALLKENSLFHEIGHIFTSKYQGWENSKGEEIIAFLSELQYGPLPFESLDTIISAAYQSRICDYNLAGREIVSYFLSYIKDEQKRGNSGYKNIHISGINQLRKMTELYELTESQLRSISECTFKQKYNYNERR